jgi:tRNA(fMet)-specific endonuclease VapC
MTGNDVALDTSAAVQLLNNMVLARTFLGRVSRVHLPAIAAGELLYGAFNSAQRKSNVPRYQEFINHCSILQVAKATAEIYAATRLQLKAKGLPIPDADIWIAACAMEHSLPIVSTDKHFSHITGLSLIPLDLAT